MPRQLIEIRRHTDQQIVFRGNYTTLADALEAAARDGNDLNYTALHGVIAPRRSLQGFRGRGVILDNADFHGSNLEGSSFQDASFRGANLGNANMNHGTMRNAQFAGAWLVGAQFFGTDLRNTDFRGAVLDGVDFTNANLTGAVFFGASVGTVTTDGARGFNSTGSMPYVAGTAPSASARPRTVKEYLAHRKASVTVERMQTPSPVGIMPLWDVRIKVGKRKARAVVQSEAALDPTTAVVRLMEIAPYVDNGRGDCKCGCGITPRDVYFANNGYRHGDPRAAMLYSMSLDASKALREAFGNDREGYNMLMGMNRR